MKYSAVKETQKATQKLKEFFGFKSCFALFVFYGHVLYFKV